MQDDRTRLRTVPRHRTWTALVLTALVAAVAAGACGDDDEVPTNATECRTGQRLCDGVCVDLMGDETNCG
ncbi:MAG TPA: hypothetical protein PLU22_27810, partial [Polyangiaceae bacterium]|nr:hypothetical protein [Polyangiaceae bacterium]